MKKKCLMNIVSIRDLDLSCPSREDTCSNILVGMIIRKMTLMSGILMSKVTHFAAKCSQIGLDEISWTVTCHRKNQSSLDHKKWKLWTPKTGVLSLSVCAKRFGTRWASSGVWVIHDTHPSWSLVSPFLLKKKKKKVGGSGLWIIWVC